MVSQEQDGPPTGDAPQLVPFGKPMRKYFLLDPKYRNFNQGSYGTIPRHIQNKQREYQDAVEARPDPFVRYEYGAHLDASRAAVASLLNARADDTVLVSNASTAANVVLRNMAWSADGRDEILYFETAYVGCQRTIDYVVDTRAGAVAGRRLDLAQPAEDGAVVARLAAGIRASRGAGRRPRLALFDTVSSMPGVRCPFERLTALCRAEGVLSLVDGAQGVGMLHLDLAALDADFFFSNCHKWLHVPRGCAVLVVAARNHHVLRSTLPTAHGYVARSGPAGREHLPPPAGAAFVHNFQLTATMDNSPYLCVRHAVEWRREFLGGEERVRAYLWKLAKEGGRKVAEILGTGVMDNSTGTLTNCGMVNVEIPLKVVETEEEEQRTRSGTKTAVLMKDLAVVHGWMQKVMIQDYKTFAPILLYNGHLWVRLSAQVFLDMEDFEYMGRTLAEVCDRVGKGDYKMEIGVPTL